jgi:predicted Rossmann-fold nucleotide-binding protein
MQHWTGIEPNRWNAALRWSNTYGARLDHLLRCDAIIALPGGVGTLSEMAVAWAASQTEVHALPIVLLGDCWPPIVQSFREHLVVSSEDLTLLRFAASPQEAVQAIRAELQQPGQARPGPRG